MASDQRCTKTPDWVYEFTGILNLSALAVDGKALRGARLDSGGQVHLLSALIHDEGIVIAQRNVDGKTNEIVRPERRVVTM